MVNVITDRTMADVAEALQIIDAMRNGTAAGAQRAKYLAGLRGTWGRIDTIRIQDAVAQISQALVAKGKDAAVTRVTISAWRVSTLGQLNQILANIDKLRRAYYVKPTTPDTPSLEGEMTIQKANDIEQILLDISILLDNEPLSYCYAGTQFNAGGESL